MNRPLPRSCTEPAAGPLGDTARRDYARKLKLFNAFARPELNAAIADLRLSPASRVLDAGCGTGEALGWLQEAIGDDGVVVGMDLATAHLCAARDIAPLAAPIVQADMQRPPFADRSFDLVWAVNAINHLRDPVAGIQMLSKLLRPGGRIAIGQSSFLPDMYFAWDARLERVVNEAVRAYYRARYGRSEREFGAVRGLAGWLQRAGLRGVDVRTRVIERTHPLSRVDEEYLLEAIFRGTWGERLRGYMDREDFEELSRLCDPDDERYALRRPDFHFLQTFTLAVATRRFG